jgi:hypothetical protein
LANPSGSSSAVVRSQVDSVKCSRAWREHGKRQIDSARSRPFDES